MKRDARAYLWDVKEAIGAIEEFLAGQDFEEYQRNRLVRSAVERQLEIVGEALGQLAKVAPELSAGIPATPSAVGLRNRLAHGYFVVDNALVWSTAQKHLPPLRAAIEALLHELDEKGNTP